MDAFTPPTKLQALLPVRIFPELQIYEGPPSARFPALFIEDLLSLGSIEWSGDVLAFSRQTVDPCYDIPFAHIRLSRSFSGSCPSPPSYGPVCGPV